MGREGWIDAYKEAAPRIQNIMDTQVASVVQWGPKANNIDCTQDIRGRVRKINVMRRECKKMQELEQMLAPKTPFESNVPDDKGAFIPVKCVMGGQGMCQALNCYSDDADLLRGITLLRSRAKVCQKALGILVEEEERNGPIGDEAEVSARTGGRLEVPLPPPGVEFQEGEEGGGEAAPTAQSQAVPLE